MKKRFVINMIIVAAFFLLEPLLEFCGDWANTYNLGAELVLGMFVPFLFASLVIAALGSALCSIAGSCRSKDIKQILPILVLVIGVIVYIWTSDSESFWIRIVDFYTDVENW